MLGTVQESRWGVSWAACRHPVCKDRDGGQGMGLGTQRGNSLGQESALEPHDQGPCNKALV